MTGISDVNSPDKYEMITLATATYVMRVALFGRNDSSAQVRIILVVVAKRLTNVWRRKFAHANPIEVCFDI